MAIDGPVDGPHWLRGQERWAQVWTAPAGAAGQTARDAGAGPPGLRFGWPQGDRFERVSAPPRVDAAAAPGGAAPSPLARDLNRGFQYLIGLDFTEGAAALTRGGAQGVAVLDRDGATPAGVAALRRQGVAPIAYNNAFQLQPGERPPPGVRVVDNDGQWGEGVPDFRNPAWQNRRIGEAVAAAQQGFAGVMLDNVPRAGTSREAADYVARMVREARTASGNPRFSAILQNGEELVRAHPWLVDQGLVGAVQREDVSYRVRGAGTGTGVPSSAEERAATERTFRELRARHPSLPLIAVDYPRDLAQARDARERARRMGFNVSHLAVGDGELRRLSRETQVLAPAPAD